VHLAFVSVEVVNESGAMFSAGRDRFIDTVSHLLHFGLPLFVLLHGVVVDALTFRTQLIAKSDVSAVKAYIQYTANSYA